MSWKLQDCLVLIGSFSWALRFHACWRFILSLYAAASFGSLKFASCDPGRTTDVTRLDEARRLAMLAPANFCGCSRCCICRRRPRPQLLGPWLAYVFSMACHVHVHAWQFGDWFMLMPRLFMPCLFIPCLFTPCLFEPMVVHDRFMP